MSSSVRLSRGRAALPWLLVVVAVTAAFALGGLLLGGSGRPIAASTATSSAPGWAVAKTSAEVAFFQQLDEVNYGVMGAAEQTETLTAARYVCALHASGMDEAHALLSLEASRQLRRGDDATVVVAAISNLCAA